MSSNIEKAPWFTRLPTYPVNGIYDRFLHRDKSQPLLIEAEPGAGKSTLVPLWVLAELLRNQTVSGEKPLFIYLVQPRILAAQSLAKRLALLVNSKLGELVGYQVPYDSVVSPHTCLVVTTPGLLVQKLINNPELSETACVILDEIHERSVNQDLLYTLLQDVQVLNENLELIVMSATPDPILRQQLPNSLYTEGVRFPVNVSYQPTVQKIISLQRYERESLAEDIHSALSSVENWQAKTVLIFLPGWSVIERCFDLLSSRYNNILLTRLHSRVAYAEQQVALDPSRGPRLILSTNIAETSLTIADVTLVIDSGLAKRQVFEQKTGLGRLRTSRISQASADQRAGRAGRVQAGECIRLWPRDERLAAADLPELRATDYLPFALKVSHWGASLENLNWLEKPSQLAFDQAVAQLQRMRFIEANGVISPQGIKASELGTHPRIAGLLLTISHLPDSNNQKYTYSLLLMALALHFDVENTSDIPTWLALAENELNKNHLWKKQYSRWRKQLQLDDKAIRAEINIDSHLGELIAPAFVDRVGVKQASGRYSLASGVSVNAFNSDVEFVVFVQLFLLRGEYGGLALPLVLDQAARRFLSLRRRTPGIKQGKWQWHDEWLLGGKVIDEQWVAADEEVLHQACENFRDELIENIHRKELIELLPQKAAHLLAKSRLLQREQLIELPELSDSILLETLPTWLAPFMTLTTPRDKLPWQPALEFYMGFDKLMLIENLLPDYVTLPSGRKVAVDFSDEGDISISAKLQEFFGCEELRFAEGKLPLKISLLSPNGSPLAVTANLKTFWQNAYPDVRKTMRGRYPRHPWPENPLEHEATALTKRRLQQQSPEK